MIRGKQNLAKIALPALLTVTLIFAAIPSFGPYPRYAVGKSVGQMSYSYIERSYADIVKRAPIIAEVEITHYYGSVKNATGCDCTWFNAQVIKCYKNTTGQNLSSIPLLQDGTSDLTIHGYPLFQTGDRLLLTLASASYFGGRAAQRLDGYYLIDGGEQSAMMIISSKDGEVCRTFLPALEDLPTGGIRYSMQSAARINASQKNNVPYNDDTSYPPYRIASYDAVKEYIENILA